MSTELGKIIADFQTQLATEISIGGTTATLSSILDDDAVTIPNGRYFFTIDGDNSSKEHISCDLSGASLTNIKTVSRQGIETAGVLRKHRVGALVTITDFAHIKKINDLVAGTTGFDSDNPLFYDTDFTPTSPEQIIPKSYADGLALGNITLTPVVTPGNAGETVVAKKLVYLNPVDSEWYLADATLAAEVENAILGITNGAGTDGAAITSGVTLLGKITGFTGLTANSAYYASNTAGEISTTPGTKEVTIGIAVSTTELVFSPRYNQQITEDQQDALESTSGTPSALNKYVSENDTTNAETVIGTGIAFVESGSQITDSGNGLAGFRVGASIIVSGTVSNDGTYTVTAVAAGALTVAEALVDEAAGSSFTITASLTGKVVRMGSDDKLPAYDGSNLVGVATSQSTLTASGDLQQYDAVYPTATGDEVAAMLPASADAAAAVAQAISNLGAPRLFKLSEGRIIQFNGGSINASFDLYAQVRNINSTEDNFTDGTAAAVFTTSNGVQGYAVTQLADEKFLVIYNKNTGSAAGTACKVVTVSGNTITVGSEESIESTGAVYIPGVSKLDTDKAIIFYREDTSQDMYCRVLSISGTTITSNTEVVVDTTWTSNGNSVIEVQQITTDKVLVLYSATQKLYARVVTVAGTTPTVGSANELIDTGTSSCHSIGLKMISETSAILIYAGNGDRDFYTTKVAISGDTVTIGSTLLLYNGSTFQGIQVGLYIISPERAVFSILETTTAMKVGLLNISGATPTLIEAETIVIGDLTGTSYGSDIVQVLPWVYYATSTNATGDSLYKLNPPTTTGFIGVANADITDTQDGVILHKNIIQVGFTGLTPGTTYYINDDGSYTAEQSTKSIKYGVAISSTKMLLG